MNKTIDIKDWYISNFGEFEKRLNGGKESSIHQKRKDALSNFSRLEFPTIKDEEWKYTSIAPLLKYNFVPSYEKKIVSKDFIKSLLFDEMEHSLIVFINGRYSAENSILLNLPEGVIAGSIANEIRKNNEVLLKYFGKYADHQNHIFTALSTAYTEDGAFIYIPTGKIVEEPLHIIFITDSGNEKILIQPRNLFIAEKNSQVTIIEHYVGNEGEIYFTNSVTEIVAEENAVVDHIKLQEESKKAFHIARMEVDQERSSNFSSHLISTGAVLTRNEFNARFNNEGGECTLNGLYIIDGTQLFDAHTLMDHAKPHCNSHEHYKGILDDKSRGVFNGKIIVRQDAQKTNAFQENNSILLSDEALVNTKPQLEIFADDVKCSHGATIGQMDDDAKFYLKSRGIGEEASKGILLHAFASDVITSIKIESVRNYIEKIITEKFNQ
ncbi:MAG: Fe-S cluster assembly protein SufD [Ignavibacteria bacterium RBG_16_36_9]|nr:MAG: Fe-S cluster assembly protein SufD [Ignavibacteria bacterium RBG_16_36_9]